MITVEFSLKSPSPHLVWADFENWFSLNTHNRPTAEQKWSRTLNTPLFPDIDPKFCWGGINTNSTVISPSPHPPHMAFKFDCQLESKCSNNYPFADNKPFKIRIFYWQTKKCQKYMLKCYLRGSRLKRRGRMGLVEIRKKKEMLSVF